MSIEVSCQCITSCDVDDVRDASDGYDVSCVRGVSRDVCVRDDVGRVLSRDGSHCDVSVPCDSRRGAMDCCLARVLSSCL